MNIFKLFKSKKKPKYGELSKLMYPLYCYDGSKPPSESNISVCRQYMNCEQLNDGLDNFFNDIQTVEFWSSLDGYLNDCHDFMEWSHSPDGLLYPIYYNSLWCSLIESVSVYIELNRKIDSGDDTYIFNPLVDMLDLVGSTIYSLTDFADPCKKRKFFEFLESLDFVDIDWNKINNNYTAVIKLKNVII